MYKQKLCLILSLFSLWTHHSYCAMNQIQGVRINNGLLTKVPKILVAIKWQGIFNIDYYYNGIENSGTQDSLANLMNRNYTTIDDYDGRSDRFIPKSLFFPTVVKIDNNKLTNLGSFCNKVHKEAKEACRQNKAIFYPFQQGLIIYSDNNYNASNYDIFEENKKQLEEMACHNLQKKFIVYASVFCPIWVEPQAQESDQSTDLAVEENKGNRIKEIRTSITELFEGFGIGLD